MSFSIARAQGQTVILEEGFEGAFPGAWTVEDRNTDGGLAHWSDVNFDFGGEGAHSGAWKGYCAGIGHQGSTANPAYQSFMDASLSTSIDLSGYQGATLSFWSKIPSIESPHDTATVYVRTAGAEEVWAASGPLPDWTEAVVDLSAYVGGEATLEFVFASDQSVTHEGWYLDDILVTRTSGLVNDQCGGALPLESGVPVLIDTSLATSTNDPVPGCQANFGKGVWFSYAHEEDGPVLISTGGSDFDTVLQVFEGDCGMLVPLPEGCNDDNGPAGGASQASVEFRARPGIRYFILAGGFQGAGGTLQILLEHLPAPPFVLEINSPTGGQAELHWPAYYEEAFLQWSTDLMSWSPLDLPVLAGSGTNFVRIEAPGAGAQFYRAAILPLVHGVGVTTGAPVEVGEALGDGVVAYTDREVVYDLVPPELQGLTTIKTPNDDKFQVDPHYMTLALSQDAAVYIAYDDRYTVRPDWLSAFSDTGFDLWIGPTMHSVYRKICPAGETILGGNYVAGQGNFGMFTVLVGRPEVSFPGVFGAPLFVGSYLKVPVRIDRPGNLTFEDLDFVVPAGPKGGSISYSREESHDPGQPEIMLLVGYEQGSYRLQAIEKATGTIMGEKAFEVTTEWGDPVDGPSLWVTGDYELQGVPGAAWGGGSSTTPENHNLIPANGTRQVAILLVDTASERFSAGEHQAVRDLWQEVAFDGRLDGNNRRVSTADYFTEASYGNFTIAGGVFGPVHLAKGWNSYLENNGKYKGNLWAACAEAGDSLIDYSQFDSLVCVINSVTSPKLGVWPHADSMVAKVKEGNIPLGTVDMPAEGDFNYLAGTLAHELCHNLGLGDIYSWGGHTAQIQARELQGLAMMARGNKDLSHPVLVHRMRLGWVPQDKLKLYNFQASGGTVDETITLHPAELANPPAGRYSGIEVRIAPSWNYYFEYRSPQTTQIGDQALWWPNGASSANNRVIGTDVNFASNLEDLSRRKPVMVLPMDSDGDGPVLGLNQDYRERDITGAPGFPTDFSAEVTHIDGSRADVRVRYQVVGQPDPSIRPWNPPNYRSPDIEVRNAKSQADPKWANVPWEDHMNTLVARVTNRGELNAPGVWVDFYIKDFTVNSSGVQKILVGSDQRDVPAGQTVEFTTQWRPKKAGHYCVEVRIRLYQTPTSVLEVTEFNNRAQSNYVHFISATASAAVRKVTSVVVHNPFSEPARAKLRLAKGTSPLFRTYLRHSWLTLQPGETREVGVMFEYAYGDVAITEPEFEPYIGQPNDVTIEAHLLLDADPPGPGDPFIESPRFHLGGASARVATGRATSFDTFWFDAPDELGGRVVTIDDGQPVPGGSVVLAFTVGEEIEYGTASVGVDGVFGFIRPDPWETARGFYIGINALADSESERITPP